MRSERAFGGLLSAGLSFALVIQAIINMCVVVGLLPVTGLTLPLISMGGTSQLFTGITLGIILSVSRYNEDENNNNKWDYFSVKNKRYICSSTYVKSCESYLDSIDMWSIPPSRRLIGILLGGQKAKLSREELHLPLRLTDYSSVSNATIYESNFHGYLHIPQPRSMLWFHASRKG